MLKIVISLLTIILQGALFAQSPIVPHKMTIGNIEIKITEGARAEIQKNVDELTRHPKYFNVKVDLANQYFPFIEEAFRDQGIPEDIKYLVIQESGLIADAVSTSNAVGYWQFKDFTAIEMGLRVDRQIDERKSIYAASIGAAKYMKMNNGYFDNWIYAIQAYQMGAGGALKVTNKKMYGEKQMTITKKTYWYVKKYLAHKVAYENAVGKSKPSIYLSAYKSGAGKSLNEIAKKLKINEEELIKYNKWLKRGKIPYDRKYVVIIPAQELTKVADDDEIASKTKNIIVRKAPSYNQVQAKFFPVIKPWKGNAKYSDGTVYINKLPGMVGTDEDMLAELAKKGNLSLRDFLNINDIERNHVVANNEVFYFKKKKSKAKVYYHVMGSDETLWSISQKYGIQLKKLLMKNRIVGNEKIKKGRVLWMRNIRPENIAIEYENVEDAKPIEIRVDSLKKKIDELQVKESLPIDSIDNYETDDPLLDSIEYKEFIHSVRRGDTYYNIANLYNVGVLELVNWNGLELTDKLSIDQQLKVRTNIEIIKDEIIFKQEDFNVLEQKTLKNTIYHIVKKGETMYSISRKYGLALEALKKINNKVENEVAIGEQLKVSNEE